MDLRQAAAMLAGSGDANARVTLPVTVGISRWSDETPAHLRRMGIEAGLDSVATRVRGVLMARVVTVSMEGPADRCLAYIGSLQELAD